MPSAGRDPPACACAAVLETAKVMPIPGESSIALLPPRGIIVVDVPGAKLSFALMDAYLDVKARGRL